MTTGQTMLERVLCFRRLAPAAVAALLVSGLFGPGCAAVRPPVYTPPATLSAPYDRSRGDVLWAVVPLRNETGTTVVDVMAVSDRIVAAASQVKGVRTLPLNRTIATMRALGMNQLSSPAEARTLATEMGADGIIVGSVTAFDPYNPPTLGIALALYSRTTAMDVGSGEPLDTRRLQVQPTDYQYFPRSSFPEGPASVIAEHLDAKNHQVLIDVQAYAKGRHDPNSAFGWKRYLASMDLFTEFAAWHALSRLLDHEWARLSRERAPIRK